MLLRGGRVGVTTRCERRGKPCCGGDSLRRGRAHFDESRSWRVRAEKGDRTIMAGLNDALVVLMPFTLGRVDVRPGISDAVSGAGKAASLAHESHQPCATGAIPRSASGVTSPRSRAFRARRGKPLRNRPAGAWGRCRRVPFSRWRGRNTSGGGRVYGTHARWWRAVEG